MLNNSIFSQDESQLQQSIDRDSQFDPKLIDTSRFLQEASKSTEPTMAHNSYIDRQGRSIDHTPNKINVEGIP